MERMSTHSVRRWGLLTSQFFIKAETAPTTAFNGRNMSEDSLVTSTAILTAAYAVRQPESLSLSAEPSLDISRVLTKPEVMERAMADDVAAIAVESR